MIRMALRIEREHENLVTLALFVNGARASGTCGITVRRAELIDLIKRMNPDGIEVDTEMVSSYLVERLHGFQNTRFV